MAHRRRTDIGLRVGVLTSYQPHEIGIAWATLPLMRRYCRARGYTLAVGQGMSAEGMFDRFADQFETAMLFVPIAFVITDTLVPLKYGTLRATEPPEGLGTDATGEPLATIRWWCVRRSRIQDEPMRFRALDRLIDREDMI